MKRILAVLLGLMIACLSLAALADDLDDEFAEAFDGFRIDPFADFEPSFGDDSPDLGGDDPFAGFIGDDSDPYAAFFGDGGAGPFGNAFMSYDNSDAEDSEDPFADPGPEATPAPSASANAGSIRITIAGEPLTLSFDPSPAYSSVQDHLVQAAFYTYGSATGNLYELFLSFPDSVRAGDAITPEYAMKSAIDSSIVLLISTAEKDTFYVASQQSTTGPYPETSSYTMRFDAVTPGDDSTTYAGSITANLVSYSQKTGKIDETVHIEDAAFSFTMPNAAGSGSDSGSGSGDAPGGSAPEAGDDFNAGDGSGSADPFDEFTDLPTLAPLPTPTLDPDFRKV